MKIIQSFAFILSSLLSLSTFAQNDGKVNVEKGKKFSVENSVVSLSTTESQGKSFDMKAVTSSIQTVEVKEKKEASYIISNTLTKVKTSFNAGDQDMKFDSDKSDDLKSEDGEPIAKILNKSKDMEIDFSGKEINAKDSKSETDEQKESKMILMMLFGGNEYVSIFQPLPNGIKVGDTWTENKDDKETKGETIFSVQEINGNEMKLMYKTTLKITKSGESQGSSFTSTSDVEVTGDETVEISTGVIKQKNSTADMKTNIDASGQTLTKTNKKSGSYIVKFL